MANGDRTRRKQDDEQPGLFDHIVAADLEGIDPPSMDGVPEVQVHEPTPPPPGQTLAAWGDEDPTLTAPRVVEPTDAWESVEPKAETTIELPAEEPTDEPPVEAVVEAEVPSRDRIEPEPLVEPASIDEPQPSLKSLKRQQSRESPKMSWSPTTLSSRNPRSPKWSRTLKSPRSSRNP